LRSDNKGSKFVKLLLDCYLEQHVKHSIRMVNILDLVFTSDLVIKDDIQILAPLDKCDHNVLMWVIDSETSNVSDKVQLCYNQADYKAMCSFVYKRLEDMDSSMMSASCMWQSLSDILQEAITRYIPQKTVTIYRKKPLWMSIKKC